jgi:CBS domain-containing protein
MRAAEFMTEGVVTTRPSESVKAATRLLLEHRAAALPVVEDGRLVGIVSELDMLRERVPRDPRAHALSDVRPTVPTTKTVADVMVREIYALPDTADQAAFAELMLSAGVKSIPVVRGEHLVGIVGRRDLLRLLARDDALITDDVIALMRAESSAVGAWDVTVEDGEVALTGEGTSQQLDAAVVLTFTVPDVVGVRRPSA